MATSKSDGPERWRLWRTTYFPDHDERGLTWGGGPEVRFAFTPHRLFSAEIYTGFDKILARDEASYPEGTIRASYDLLSWRLGGHCLFPRIWRFRIGVGPGLALISRTIKVEVGGMEREDENNSPFDAFLNGTVRFEATEEIGVDAGLMFTLSDSTFAKGGVSYAF